MKKTTYSKRSLMYANEINSNSIVILIYVLQHFKLDIEESVVVLTSWHFLGNFLKEGKFSHISR